MGTSRLRRWVLRGALFSATVVAPVMVAQPAHADWTWQDAPRPITQSSQDPEAGSHVADQVFIEEDWVWQ